MKKRPVSLSIISAITLTLLTVGAHAEVLTVDLVIQNCSGPEALDLSACMSAVETSETNFDMGLSNLRRLKDANVPDELISLMQRVSVEQRTVTATVATKSSDSPCERAGIFAETSISLVEIHASTADFRMKGLIKSAFSYGAAKTKTQAVLQRPNRRFSLTGTQPPDSCSAYRRFRVAPPPRLQRPPFTQPDRSKRTSSFSLSRL